MKKMRILAIVAVIAIALGACSKDKFQTVPHIKFNSFSPNIIETNNTIRDRGPFMSIQVTDAEGDFGFSAGEDTSYVYVKNITIPPFAIDSLPFPSAKEIKRKDLNAEVVVNLFYGKGILRGTPTVPTHPYVDTLRFEVYVRDFANNKSNVITTEPFYLITP